MNEPRIKMVWPRIQMVAASKVVARANDHKDTEAQREQEMLNRSGHSDTVATYRPFRADQYHDAADYLSDEGEATFSGDWQS